MSMPLVAIPASHLPADRVAGWRDDGFGLPGAYVHAQRAAGLQPVIVPGVGGGADADAVAASFSGVVLAGGGDVDPTRYGAEPHPSVYGVHPARDDFELALVTAALARQRPVLAICRGMQVVNVACGGTLWQHLPDVEGSDVHGDPTAKRWITHDVTVAAGSRLAAAVAGRRLAGCVSHHHQGVAQPGHGLVPVAWAGDGLVEAMEAAGDGWLLAVQWHPEVNAGDDPRQHAIFARFAAQVRAQPRPG